LRGSGFDSYLRTHAGCFLHASKGTIGYIKIETLKKIENRIYCTRNSSRQQFCSKKSCLCIFGSKRYFYQLFVRFAGPAVPVRPKCAHKLRTLCAHHENRRFSRNRRFSCCAQLGCALRLLIVHKVLYTGAPPTTLRRRTGVQQYLYSTAAVQRILFLSGGYTAAAAAAAGSVQDEVDPSKK
jgi:hypothetical protein